MINNLEVSSVNEGDSINFSDRDNRFVRPSPLIIFLLLLVTTYVCSATLLSRDAIQYVILSGDQLTLPSLARDIISNPIFSFHTWMLPRAPYVFPDLAIVLGLKEVIENDAWVVVVELVIHIGLMMILSYMLLTRMAISSSVSIRSIGIFSILCTFICLLVNSYWSFILSAAPFQPLSHATSFGMGIFSALWFEKNITIVKNRYIDIVLFSMVCGLFVLSDKIFLICFSLPYFISLVVFLNKKDNFIRPVLFLASQAVAFAGAFAVSRLFLFQSVPVPQFMSVLTNFGFLINAVHRQNGFMSLYYIVGTCLIFFVLCRGLFRRFRSPVLAERSAMRLQVFVALSALASIALCILLWQEDADGFARYGIAFQLAIPLCAALLSAEILQFRAKTTITFSLASLFILAGGAMLFGRTNDPFAAVGQQAALGSELNACAKREGLVSGFAGYSWARRLSSATDWNVQVDQMEPYHPTPFFWGNDFLWFYADLKKGTATHHNFILENDLGAEPIAAAFGPPSRHVECGPLKISVYNDPAPIDRHFSYLLNRTGLSDSLREHIPIWMQKAVLLQDTDIDASAFLHQVGEKNGETFAVSEPSPAGVLMYGPYITLPAGKYRLERDFSCIGNKATMIFDITGSGGKDEIDRHVMEPNSAECDGLSHLVSEQFTLQKKSDAVEFRVLYGGAGSLTVTKVHLSSAPLD